MKHSNYTKLIIMIMWLPTCVHAQDAGKGNAAPASLTVNRGAQMIISGDAKLVLNNASFINNGTLQAGTGTFIFTDAGMSPSFIAGSAATNLHNLITDKPNSVLQLENDIAVRGVLQLKSGNIELNRHNIDLGQTGTIAGENANARITGFNGGTITIMARLNAPSNANPGNIGALISSKSDLGATFITRGHVQQVNALGQTSINRYYDIKPAYGSSSQIDLRFQYLEPELGKNKGNELVMWSGTGTQWFAADNNGSGENWVFKNNLQPANRFTLGAGENAKANAQAVQTYPNPATDKFTLAVTSRQNMQGYIMLQDEFGRVLEKRAVNYRAGVNTMEWNVGRYAAGNYYLVFDIGWQNTKIIKQ